MKLKEGQTVHVGREKFVGEIPDDKAKKAGLLRDKPVKEAEKRKDEHSK